MSTLLQKPEIQTPEAPPSPRRPDTPALHRFQKNRTPALNLGECVHIALQGLAANKMRAMLTMLGIIIGVGAVITMIAVGQGARQKTLGQIQALGTNVLIIQSGQTKSGGVFGGAGSFRNISFDDLDAILKKCPAVAAVSGEDITQAQVKGGSTNTNTSVLGIGAEYADIRNFTLANGRNFTQRDIRGRSPVCILGAKVATDFFKDKSPLEQRIRINSTSYRVVGVMARKGQVGSQNADDQVFLPLSTFQHKLGRWWWRGRVATADIQAVSAGQMDEAAGQVKSLLRQQHHVKPDHPDDITINNQAEIAAVAEQTTRTFTFLLASIAGVSLLVGGIGIMNIMLVSVTERTREIGVRKAIGAKRRDILWQFLIESVVLSLLGGVIGIALGTGGALLLGHFSSDYTPILTLPPVLLAFGFAAAVGIFFGFYPAQKASRLTPIEALRHEQIWTLFMITLTDITKTYQTGSMALTVLKGITLTIGAGEMVAIMGPSGSGKSTLMNIIGCLDQPTSGSYALDGFEVANLDENTLAEIRNVTLGFVFQQFNLLARTTALRNVELPLIYSGERDREELAKRALARVGLSDRMDHTPAQLSGGQQQRVAIARAIVNNPPILFGDEPTGALDTKTGEEIMGIFQGLNNEGKTVVLVTHEEDIAEHCHRILRFRDGSIVSDEPVKDRRIAPMGG